MAKNEYRKWLKRAESNLLLAKSGHIKGVVYEDLCFEAQQSAEKALKALLVYFGDRFPKVHSLFILLERLQKYTDILDDIKVVLKLSAYAVQTRYPGEYYPVQRKEYQRAVNFAQKILTWVKKLIKKRG